MNTATTQALLSVLRSLLIVAGSWVTAKGYLSEGNTSELIGAIMVLVPVLWGVWQKYNSERKTKVREVTAVNVGIVVADQTVGPTPPVSAVVVPALIAAVGELEQKP